MQSIRRLTVCLLALTLTAIAPSRATEAQPAQPAQPRLQPQPAVAAPLADRVPAGALAYVGWAGTERIAATYEGTHAQALLRQSNLEDVFNGYIPELLARLAQEEPEAREAIAAFSDVAPTLLRRPTAVAFGGFNTNLGGAPVPKVMVFCDAGEQAQAVERRLRRVFDQAEQPALKGFVSRQGGIVRFALGYDLNELDRLATGNGNGEGTLQASEPFRASFAGLVEQPTVAMYADFPALIALGEQMAGQFAGAEQKQQVSAAIEILGVRGLGRLAVTSGFAERNWETRGFLGVTGRQGVMRLLPSAALDEQILNAVPADATLVAADQMDIAVVLDVIRDLVTTFAPAEAQEQINGALAQLNEAAGVDVERDVLRQFGPAWAAYTSPRVGSGIFSGVLVNRPRDAAALGRSLGTAATNGVNLLNEQVRNETEGNLSVPARSVEVDGQSLYVLNLPLLAPTWSVDGEAKLIRFGLYPQSVLGARAIAGGDSFGQSQRWRELRDRLSGGQPVASVRFADLPELAPHAYPLILMGSQTLFGAGDLFGEKLGTRPPVVVLPPLTVVLEHTELSAMVSWVTPEGIRFRGVEPFPMSSLLATDPQSFMLNLLSSIGPALGMAGGEVIDEFDPAEGMQLEDEEAKRVKSASNLRHIGQALVKAAFDDAGQGRYPDDLATLFLTSGLPMEIFLSARTATRLPEIMAQAREVQARWVQGNSDFVYIGWGLPNDAPPDVVVVYENPDLVTDREGINVLFADGAVVFRSMADFDRIMRRHVEYRREKGLQIPEWMDGR